MKQLHGLPLLLVTHLIRENVWVSKGVLTADMVWKHPKGKNYGKRYLPETVGRALRSMEEQKIIAVRDSGISVEYKYLPPEYRKRYIPSSSRPSGMGHKLFYEEPSESVRETEVEMVGRLPYKEE